MFEYNIAGAEIEADAFISTYANVVEESIVVPMAIVFVADDAVLVWFSVVAVFGAKPSADSEKTKGYDLVALDVEGNR